MVCSNCGVQVPDGAATCPKCGVVNAAGSSGASQLGSSTPDRLEITLDDLSEPSVLPPAAPPRYQPQPKSPALPSLAPPMAPGMHAIPVYNVGPPRNNGLAIASMVTGLAAMVFCYFAVIPAIVAVILGAVALNQIKESRGTQGGRGMAIAGVVLGLVWIGLTLIAAIAIAAS